MRKRLRPAYTDSELQDLYKNPYDHTKWRDHVERVRETIAFAALNVCDPVSTIADLSCGDAAIAHGIRDELHFDGRDAASLVLGDFNPGYQYDGPIEETILHLPHADLFILSETLEHLDDPDMVLSFIRSHASQLILSTPCDETLSNPEHYWSWGTADIAYMLEQTGWQPRAFQFLEFPKLDVRYQLWYAS